MEKIQKENKNFSNLNHDEANENSFYSKEQKRKNKKQVTFNDKFNNNHYFRNFTKNTQKSKYSFNKLYININRQLSKNKDFKRIRTTSRLPKEKEKEIVYNISSSLISLYKPKKKFSLSDKNK